MKKCILISMIGVLFTLSCVMTASAKNKNSKPLQIGYSTGPQNMTLEKMKYAKSVGIDCIEASLGYLIEKDKFSEDEIILKLKECKKACDDANIKIWSIHMPFGPNLDISHSDETKRQEIINLHKRYLSYCAILKPQIILYHPSFYLGLNERPHRIEQLRKSILDLNPIVKKMKADIVIENMLGYELLRDAKRERPLCRTVDEMIHIMSLLPKDVYAAVDMNHIREPQKLIRALGKRLKSLHVCDGDGKKECHYIPCSGQGENDWNDILSALNEVKYKGPFMFECAYKDVSDLVKCYHILYDNYNKNCNTQK